MPRYFFNTLDHDCRRFICLLPLFFWLVSAHSEPAIPRHPPSFESAPLLPMQQQNISVSFKYNIANSDAPGSVNASVAEEVATYFNNRSSNFVIQHQTANDDGLDLRFLVRMRTACNPQSTRKTLMSNVSRFAHAATENMKCVVRACDDGETQSLSSTDNCTSLLWTCTCSSAQAANLPPMDATQAAATAAVKDSSSASAQAGTTFASRASPSKGVGTGGDSRQAEIPQQDRTNASDAGAIHRSAFVDQRFCLILALAGDCKTSSERGQTMPQRTTDPGVSVSAAAHKITIFLRRSQAIVSSECLRDRLVHEIQKRAREGTIDVWLSSESSIAEVRISCVWKFPMYNHTVRRFLHSLIESECTLRIRCSDRTGVRDTYLKPPGPGVDRWLQYSGLRGTFYELPLKEFVRVLRETVGREEARLLRCESMEELRDDARAKQVLLFEICNVLEWHTKNNTPVQPRSRQSQEPTVRPVMGDSEAGPVNAAANDTTNISHITPAPQRSCLESGADSSKVVKQKLNFTDSPARPEGVREAVNFEDRRSLSGGNYVPMDDQLNFCPLLGRGSR